MADNKSLTAPALLPSACGSWTLRACIGCSLRFLLAQMLEGLQD